MAISGIDSLFGSQKLTEIERLRRERESKGILGQLGGGGDTVSISEEGKRLAAEMQARQSKSQEPREQEEGTAQDRFAANFAGIPGGEDEEKQAGAATGDGTSSSSSTESIKKQIQQLKAKLESLASSSLPDNVKQSTMASYQAQIQELESQLRASAAQGL